MDVISWSREVVVVFAGTVSFTGKELLFAIDEPRRILPKVVGLEADVVSGAGGSAAAIILVQ